AEVDDHEIREIPLADEAAVDDAEEAGRVVRGLLDERRQAQPPVPVQLEQHRERVLDERQARRRLEISARLLLRGMRRVIRGDDVDAVLDDRAEQRLTVLDRLDRRIALDLGAELRVAPLIEPEMMHADLGGDAFTVDRTRVEQLELAGGRQMQNVKTRPVPLRERDRER